PCVSLESPARLFPLTLTSPAIERGDYRITSSRKPLRTSPEILSSFPASLIRLLLYPLGHVRPRTSVRPPLSSSNKSAARTWNRNARSSRLPAAGSRHETRGRSRDRARD